MSANEYAEQQYEIWSHLPWHARWDQIEAHMESEGFTDTEIHWALDELYDRKSGG